MRRAVRLLLIAVAAGGLVFLFVLPARTWLNQTRAMSTAEKRAALLSRENKALALRASQLQNPAYVEQIARQQYGLELPGEQAYEIVLPAATTTTTTTTVPPASHRR
jgi:cell division protein FtsB